MKKDNTNRDIQIFENYLNGQTLKQAGNGLSVERTRQLIRKKALQIHLKFVRTGRMFNFHDWSCMAIKEDSDNWLKRLAEYKNED